MVELVVILALLFGLWLFGSILGLVFKLVFALLGGLFSLLGGLLMLFVGLVVLLPITLLVFSPLILPLAFVAGAVWLVVHLAHKPRQPGASSAGTTLPDPPAA